MKGSDATWLDRVPIPPPELVELTGLDYSSTAIKSKATVPKSHEAVQR